MINRMVVFSTVLLDSYSQSRSLGYHKRERKVEMRHHVYSSLLFLLFSILIITTRSIIILPIIEISKDKNTWVVLIYCPSLLHIPRTRETVEKLSCALLGKIKI